MAMNPLHETLEACGSSASLEPQVAEYNATQMRGKTVDNRIPIRTSKALTLTGQLTGAMCCPKCLLEGLNDISLGSRQLDKHIRTKHTEVNLSWQCGRCKKVFPRVHGWRVHVPTCTGPPMALPAAHTCTECRKGFATRSGLSQHERHDHPSMRNAERMEAATRPHKQSGHKRSVWSEEELVELKKREAEIGDVRYINIALMKFFPGKTNKQISDVRRKMQMEHHHELSGHLELSDTVADDESVNDSNASRRSLTPPIEHLGTTAEGDSSGRPDREGTDPPGTPSLNEEVTEVDWKGNLVRAIERDCSKLKKNRAWVDRCLELTDPEHPHLNEGIEEAYKA